MVKQALITNIIRALNVYANKLNKLEIGKLSKINIIARIIC